MTEAAKSIRANMPIRLDSFFAPRSIAMIGASRRSPEDPGRLFQMLRKNEYTGEI
jgi:acetyltransferase